MTVSEAASSTVAAPAGPDEATALVFVAATYNVHRCFGTDGRYSPARIADVIGELKADIVGLQEVDRQLTAGRGLDQLAYLADRLGYHCVAGSRTGGAFASGRCGRCQNALLSRWPTSDCRLIDLTVPGREPRSAVDADIAVPALRPRSGAADAPPLRTVVTHFGLRGGERRRQLDTLLARLDGTGDAASPFLLMGDLNEWQRSGPISRGLHAALMCGRSVGSFPSRYPFLPLDRICGRSMIMAKEPRRHSSKTARIASDHLPVYATFRLRVGS